jgi:hypothetical protein
MFLRGKEKFMKKLINGKINIVLVLPVFLAFLSSCSSVSTNFDKSVNLSGYRTYAWKEPDVKADNPVYKGDLIDKAIKENVESELARKGLIHNDQNPDLYIVYHSYVQNVQRTAGTYGPYGPYGFYGPYGSYGPNTWYGYGYGYGYSGAYYWPSTYTATEETLALDFIDSHTNKLVWRGSMKDDVTNVSKIEKTLQKDVHAIMKKYPGTSGAMVKGRG